MKLNKDNIQRINTYLKDLLKECNKGKSEVELATSLTNAITEMNNEDDAIKEMKKYEYQCEIELYPLVQYIDANSAEEAIEEMEKQIEDSAFLQDLDGRDFHCETATQVKMTPEYKQYVDKNKIKLKTTKSGVII
tara:strand:- start:240 stop:644 length:405 start_codon:yes stop_codon:yes gene_type:complete